MGDFQEFASSFWTLAQTSEFDVLSKLTSKVPELTVFALMLLIFFKHVAAAEDRCARNITSNEERCSARLEAMQRIIDSAVERIDREREEVTERLAEVISRNSSQIERLVDYLASSRQDLLTQHGDRAPRSGARDIDCPSTPARYWWGNPDPSPPPPPGSAFIVVDRDQLEREQRDAEQRDPDRPDRSGGSLPPSGGGH